MGIKNNNTIKDPADNNSHSVENEFSLDTSGAQNFRSLQSDMVNAVKTQDRSLSQMIIADKKRKRESGYRDKKIQIKNKNLNSFSKILGGIIVVVLILTIIMLGIKAWQQKNSGEESPRERLSTAIIPINKQIILNTKTLANGEGSFITSIDNVLTKNKINHGDIVHLHLIKEIEVTDTETNKTKKTDITLPVDEFFELWENSAPESLIRSFEKENYMFGFYNNETDVIPFLLFELKSFDQTLAGILEWENVLCENMQNIFQTKECPQYKFKNAQLLDVDIRVLESEPGKPTILYGFLNGEKTLIITQSTAVFKEIKSLFD